MIVVALAEVLIDHDNSLSCIFALFNEANYNIVPQRPHLFSAKAYPLAGAIDGLPGEFLDEEPKFLADIETIIPFDGTAYPPAVIDFAGAPSSTSSGFTVTTVLSTTLLRGKNITTRINAEFAEDDAQARSHSPAKPLTSMLHLKGPIASLSTDPSSLFTVRMINFNHEARSIGAGSGSGYRAITSTSPSAKGKFGAWARRGDSATLALTDTPHPSTSKHHAESPAPSTPSPRKKIRRISSDVKNTPPSSPTKVITRRPTARFTAKEKGKGKAVDLVSDSDDVVNVESEPVSPKAKTKAPSTRTTRKTGGRRS
ncbi:hypothetical protein DL93DRAFT_2092273 [Clavulina sp. PMI_390]|nr:hypothetical protein DL93DRAFT_2092273 [Clavulina sp. PMI_390]